MTTMNTTLPTLLGCSTDDADMCDGMTFDGTAALRLAVNSESAGIIAGTSYYYAAMILWLDSTVSGGVYLLDAGRTTGIGIGFHTDPVSNGNQAVCVAINDGNSGNTYAARFEVDLKSAATERTLHSLELTYIEGEGFTLYVDGVEITAAATGGTDNGIGSSSLSTHGTLGGSVNLNTLRTRGALNASSVVGSQSTWPGADSTTVPDGEVQGGFAFVRIELSPGVAVMDMPLISDYVCVIDTDNNGVNDATNGATELPSGSSFSFDPLIRYLPTDSNELPLADPIEASGVHNAAKPVSMFRLINPSGSNYACSNITPSESGVSSIKNYIFADVDIPVGSFSSLTIPADGYIEVVVEHDTGTVGVDQAGSVSFDSSIQEITVDFLVDISASSYSEVETRIRNGLAQAGALKQSRLSTSSMK